MDKKISEIFDYGDEIVVEEQVDLFDPAEIKELTMRKIHEENAPYRVKGVKKAYRTLLIAAVITLLLVGTAVAAYQLSVKDVQVGEPYTVTYHDELLNTQQELQATSLNGLVSSPEYQAYAEWTAWNDAWREENPNPWAELGVNDAWHETPDNYVLYNAYFSEQGEKLEEIIEKYGLTLHTMLAPCDTEEDLCQVLGVSDIWRGEHGSVDSYVYNDGTFKLCFPLEEDWDNSVTMWLAVDGSFTLIGGDMAAEYDEWSYVTADGVTVALAMTDPAFGRDNAWLVARLDEALVSVSFPCDSRKTLEKYADCINFAELSRLFSTGADRSFIPAAVEAQDARWQAKQAQEAAEMAARWAEEAEFKAQHTSGEWESILLEELGDYCPPFILEGQELANILPQYGMDGYSISYMYTSQDYEGLEKTTVTYEVTYRRSWDSKEHTHSTTAEEFKSLVGLSENEDNIMNIGGYDVYVFGDGSSGFGAQWYDRERDLWFSINDLHPSYDPSYFTEEQIVDLTESYIQSINEQ